MLTANDYLIGFQEMLMFGCDDANRVGKFRNHWGKCGVRGGGVIPYAYLSNPTLCASFWMGASRATMEAKNQDERRFSMQKWVLFSLLLLVLIAAHASGQCVQCRSATSYCESSQSPNGAGHCCCNITLAPQQAYEGTRYPYGATCASCGNCSVHQFGGATCDGNCIQCLFEGCSYPCCSGHACCDGNLCSGPTAVASPTSIKPSGEPKPKLKVVSLYQAYGGQNPSWNNDDLRYGVKPTR